MRFRERLAIFAYMARLDPWRTLTEPRSTWRAIGIAATARRSPLEWRSLATLNISERLVEVGPQRTRDEIPLHLRALLKTCAAQGMETPTAQEALAFLHAEADRLSREHAGNGG